MCAFRCVRVATITTRTELLLRAPYKAARFPSKFRLAHLHVHHTELCRSWPLRPCCSSPLRLVSTLLVCASALLGFSSLLFSASLCSASSLPFCSASVLLRLRLCLLLVRASSLPFAGRARLQHTYCITQYLQ